MKNDDSTSQVSRQILLNLIKRDFEMINLFSRLDVVGFSNVDFPSITYEIFDLMGIPQREQEGELDDQYWKWVIASAGFTDELDSYVGWIYEQLKASTEKYA